ncbi:cytochrome b N-terminal domain-containing protein [Gloeobacter kilaueensis]|uniref:Cytochrome b6 n=1 Tax=Gloeobacter kilaueensis (strain ATCC BAA-2537 / CCAP 1431/1 / ULC 316 / JS1) TaxID=1183438 RepID=U5QM66_GLOK1|nr:cytochrome b N-terminal domain-containing protein [Gloeobacter kilaueensis]AGY60006.1 cytochrome b6 [Gloeobacter kilaueensis JS1]
MDVSDRSGERFKLFLPYLSSATVTFLVLALVTGVLLGAHFVPTMEAYDSTRSITGELNFGWAIRGLHWWSSSLTLICSLTFTSLAFWYGYFRGPAKWLWLSGLALGLLLLGANVTGYYLPLDQNAYWRLVIEANLFADVPVLGSAIKYFLLGGSAVSTASIVRINWLHSVVLPVFTLIALVCHVYAARKAKLI